MLQQPNTTHTGSRLEVLFEQKVVCAYCNNEADIVISEYSSVHERLIIMTLKCPRCGYRRSDVIPIIEDDASRCLEVRVEDPVDLNTLIYIPPGSSIEVPEAGLRVDVAELSDMSMGSYITVDGVLLSMVEHLERLCVEHDDYDLETVNRCKSLLGKLVRAVNGEVSPLTLRVLNSHGGVRVVKTYRENSRLC